MDFPQLLFHLIAVLIVCSIGWIAIKGWPKAIIDDDFNHFMAFQEFEELILTDPYPDYDRIRREIETFRIEYESKIHSDTLNKYIKRLQDALEDVEHGISYS